MTTAANMKILILFLVLVPQSGFAEDTAFVSRGSGLHCYQEYKSAVSEAEVAADRGARTQCGSQKTLRVSDFSAVASKKKCQVVVKASYVCDSGQEQANLVPGN